MADKDITRGDLGFIERWKDWTGHFAQFVTAILVNSSGTEVGTAAAPLRVDPTGTTSQTVKIDQTTPGTTDSVTVKASEGIGSLTETAPATDTASSGLNGRLQRIAQRLTTLIGLVPSALTGSGNFKVAVQEALPAGSNVVGKFGIDQTTPGTTDSVTVATGQGAGATVGTTADAAVVTDTTGTLSGKLRGLVKWAFERMPASLGQKTAANSLPVVVASDQGAIGTVELAADADIVEVTLSLDTLVYASGDVLAETQEVTNAFRTAGGKALLHSIKLNDKDDQGQGLDLVFLRSNVSLGTENAAPSITDANADEVLGIVSVSSGDFIDLGANRTATKTTVGLLLEAAAGATSLWIAAISRGTGTYTASGITMQLGLLRY